MSSALTIDSELQQLLRCPACGSALEPEPNAVRCTAATCDQTYPVVAGVPILIDEQQSVFSLADYRATDTAHDPASLGIRRFLPGLTADLNTEAHFARMRDLPLERSPQPVVLVIGGQVTGTGMARFSADSRLSLIETDVTIGPRTKLVCEGHSLPFADAVFDGVVIQAVLEHVLDPVQCVAEVHRVLKPGGIVYAETPFMQQVHAGAYDFTRFTPLGHRRLFRMFDEVDSGACSGPGTALAWSYEYFLRSLPNSRRGQQATTAIARLSAWWLKYVDKALIDRPNALDAACGVYFLGRWSETALPDRELIGHYRGGMGMPRADTGYPVLG